MPGCTLDISDFSFSNAATWPDFNMVISPFLISVHTNEAGRAAKGVRDPLSSVQHMETLKQKVMKLWKENESQKRRLANSRA